MEKVIEGLKHCVEHDSCIGCVYFEEAVDGDGVCRSRVDALAVLKEQGALRFAGADCECPACGSKKHLSFDSTFTYEECGYEGSGTVEFIKCLNCGTTIEICVPDKNPYEDNSNGNDAGKQV